MAKTSSIQLECEINSDAQIMLTEIFFQAGLAQPLICFVLLFEILNPGLYIYPCIFFILLNLAQFPYLTGFI